MIEKSRTPRVPGLLIGDAIWALLLCIIATAAPAQQNIPMPETGIPINSEGGDTASNFLQVPVSNLTPGAVPSRPEIKNPVANDPQAMQRGMAYFKQFNCIGCHASNGGGGMGPALSNAIFIYGSRPENIYLSIHQGRPNGMPAWGVALPGSVIWDLVTYIQSISNEPTSEWGATTSRTPPSPKIQQVPAEMVQSPTPWAHTQPFGFGQKP
jgi:cytochrome c oxidase cbb3-type subunit III